MLDQLKLYGASMNYRCIFRHMLSSDLIFIYRVDRMFTFKKGKNVKQLKIKIESIRSISTRI
jgi:hypothetical protein